MSARRIPYICAILAIICLSAPIAGCAVVYPHPDSIVLQQPRTGESVIYFLRSPHDSGQLAIETNGKRLAKLPPETYVAVSLLPGEYRFITRSGDLFSNEGIAAPLEVSLKENERKFFYVSGNEEKSVALIGVIGIQGAGPVPLLGQKSVVTNREWRECTELDARGLMTISHRIEQE